MHTNLLLSIKTTRVQNSAAAGTSNLNTTILDMEGFDSVVWTALFGTLTAGQVTSVKVQAGNVANGSDMADLVGAASLAMADGDSNKALIVEVAKNNNYRYYRLVVLRATQNAVVDGVVAQQYPARKQPTTQDATTVSDAIIAISPQYTNTALTQTTTTFSGTSTRISNTQRNSS